MTHSPVDRLTDDGRLAIFLFHGVVESCHYEVRNYTRKHLPLCDFISVLESLGMSGHPMAMDDVLEYCEVGKPFPKRAFAITFDDGFENNLTVARPVLDRLGIPATIYVTSEFVDKNGMSWIDRIEWAVERVAKGGVSVPWSSIPVGFTDKPSKIAMLDQIRRHAKADANIDLAQLVSSIFRQLNVEEIESSNDPLDRKMTWQQVKDWVAPGFAIGGHSHTHAILSHLAPAMLADELDVSLFMLRSKAGIDARHYSYPEGLSHCFSPGVIAALKARGVRCCPTAIDGVNSAGADPFLLRRISVL